MKFLFFIVLFGLSFSCFGQDSLFINFGTMNAEMTSEHSLQITNFLQNKNAESVLIKSYFSSEGDASQNRLWADVRLHVVQQAIINEGVPFNIITTALVGLEEQIANANVEIIAQFAREKGKHVLKNSSVVQISEIVYDKPSTLQSEKQPASNPPAVAEASEDNELFLDAAAFKKDATVSLPNLIFQGSSHYFISSSERVLRALLKVMKERPDIEIELQGHVCCNPPGVDAYDIDTGQKNLSVMRAKAVYNYLIDGGIPASRMTYRGFGSSQRLYPEEKNATEQMLNRRVEVLITASD